jgi:DNA-binding LacI/PurR family transcriptional regulator/ribosomal protein S25
MDSMQLGAAMSELKTLSISAQIAAHLRDELAQGRWSVTIPGRNELARQLGVGITSMEEALRQLEREGLLGSQGAGRKRKILISAKEAAGRRLRIAILSHERAALSEGYMIELIHQLREAGHDAYFTSASLLELGMDVRRISRLVKKTKADAWIVCAGSREVTEWFSSQAMPTFALFGRRRGLAMPSVGPDKSPAYVAAARRLVELGHQRIVLLVRPDRRLPVPGTPERAFFAELASHGITPGAYHFPDWEEGAEGFHTRLNGLFQLTPPTALVVDEMMLYVATQQFLAQKRLRVPEEVSLVVMEDHAAFQWCRPSLAHVRWDRPSVMRRVVGWANNVSHGKKDLRETLTRAEFIDGGTIGPARLV